MKERRLDGKMESGTVFLKAWTKALWKELLMGELKVTEWELLMGLLMECSLEKLLVQKWGIEMELRWATHLDYQ